MEKWPIDIESNYKSLQEADRLLELILLSDKWVHRRVERIEFVELEMRQNHSIDFTLPSFRTSNLDSTIVPFGFFPKEKIQNLNLTDENNRSLPVLNSEDNKKLSYQMLLILYYTVLQNCNLISSTTIIKEKIKAGYLVTEKDLEDKLDVDLTTLLKKIVYDHSNESKVHFKEMCQYYKSNRFKGKYKEKAAIFLQDVTNIFVNNHILLFELPKDSLRRRIVKFNSLREQNINIIGDDLGYGTGYLEIQDLGLGYYVHESTHTTFTLGYHFEFSSHPHLEIQDLLIIHNTNSPDPVSVETVYPSPNNKYYIGTNQIYDDSTIMLNLRSSDESGPLRILRWSALMSFLLMIFAMVNFEEIKNSDSFIAIMLLVSGLSTFLASKNPFHAHVERLEKQIRYRLLGITISGFIFALLIATHYYQLVFGLLIVVFVVIITIEAFLRKRILRFDYFVNFLRDKA